jgi:hypothetical protein
MILWMTCRAERPLKEDTRGEHGQFKVTQTAPKFEPRLRCRGQRGQNTSDRWAEMPDQKQTDFGRSLSVCVWPFEMP